MVYRQIRPFIKGHRVLDFGCGDGKIGARLAQDGYDVTLADVYKNSNIDTLGLEFIGFGQGQELPDKKKYDKKRYLFKKNEILKRSKEYYLNN